MATTNPVAVGFEHILVPTDFSEIAERALEYAKTLAKQENAELLLVHVEPPVNPISPPEAAWIDVEEIEAGYRAQLQKDGAKLASEGYRARTIFIAGPLYNELLYTIKKNRVDLIVLGTHSRRGLDRFLLGSDAEAMLRRAPCPVLSVGASVPDVHQKPWSIHEVICATTFEPRSAEVAAFAHKLAEHNGAELIFFHVRNPDQDTAVNWRAFEAAFRQYVPEGAEKQLLRTRVAHAATASSIADFARQRGSGLIVMGATPASSIVTHFPPGTIAKVLMDAPCPVMTLLQH